MVNAWCAAILAGMARCIARASAPFSGFSVTSQCMPRMKSRNASAKRSAGAPLPAFRSA